MTTRNLAQQNKNKIYGTTLTGLPIYRLNKGLNQYEEVSTSASVPSVTSPAGNVMRCEILSNNTESYLMKELYLDFLATNSSATESPTFLNVFMTLSSLVLKFNNSKVDEINSQHEILLRLNSMRRFGKDIDSAIQDIRTETGYTFAGENVAVSAGTKQFTLPLSWLFPQLENLIWPHNGVTSIVIEAVFTPNYAVAASNGFFVTSNTTTNAYDTNLTYSNIQLRQLLLRYVDQDLYSQVAPKFLRTAHEVKVVNASWNAASTTALVRLNLKNDFSSHSMIKCLHVYLNPIGLRTAYNDADNGKMYSGHSYIGWTLKVNGKLIVDYSAVADTQKRLRYAMQYQNNTFDEPLPIAYYTRDGLQQFYVVSDTIIDFSLINVFSTHETVLAGASTQSDNIEITLNCVGAVSTNVDVVCAIEYIDEIQADFKKGSYVLRQNTL